MTSIAHLHQETKVLPVKEHLQMLCDQFLANTLTRDHPSHEVVLQPQGPRKMKLTLYSKCIYRISHHLNDDGIILQINYNKIISVIHTESVSSVISSLPHNKVLGSRPLKSASLSLFFPELTNVLFAN
jgi:hypothetical protein